MGRYSDLVSKLAIAHHAGAAYRALRDCGLDALPAVRQGLRHPSADVRYWCCQYLDHFLVPDVMDEMVEMLDDSDNQVRCMALHALACDRCKEGAFHLDEAKVLPRAIALMVAPRPRFRNRNGGAVGSHQSRCRSCTLEDEKIGRKSGTKRPRQKPTPPVPLGARGALTALGI